MPVLPSFTHIIMHFFLSMSGRASTGRLFLFFSFTTLLTGMVSGCDQQPDEEKIHQQLNELVNAIESRNTGDVFDLLGDDFLLEHAAHQSRTDELRRMVTAVFLRHKSISVTLTNIKITLDPYNPQEATVTFNAFVTGGSGSSILPDQGQVYRVETIWQEDGDWLVRRASARRALE